MHYFYLAIIAYVYYGCLSTYYYSYRVFIKYFHVKRLNIHVDDGIYTIVIVWYRYYSLQSIICNSLLPTIIRRLLEQLVLVRPVTLLNSTVRAAAVVPSSPIIMVSNIFNSLTV